MENDKKVVLIAGIINATGRNLFWKNENGLDINVGDYATVENMNGYDLIKVTGKIETTEKNASKFSNTKYYNMKKVTRVIVKELIEI
ncbi:MAG: hypothetical protein HFJ55_01545 [Clostridia bacterium]|nr:hypothetical protein [Clostridia bacterium]